MLSDFRLQSGRSLLGHTFYRRWVAGDLSIDELREYARQYFHVVAALPKWLRRAAIATRNAELIDHAAEEDSHVALWLKFAEALGVSADEAATTLPNPAVAALVQDGDAFSRERAGAAVAWAVETQAAAVSAEKLGGLAAHYGIHGDGGGAYFALHGSLDLSHVSELDELIGTLGPGTHVRAQHIADVMTDRQWELLTSVERIPD